MRFKATLAVLVFCLIVAPVFSWAGATKVEWSDNPLKVSEYNFGNLEEVKVPDGQGCVVFGAPEKIYPGNAVKLAITAGSNTKNSYFAEVAIPEGLSIEPITSATGYEPITNSDGSGFAFRYFLPLKPQGGVLRYETSDKPDGITAYYALVPERPGDFTVIVNLGKDGKVYKSDTYVLKVENLPPFSKAEWKSSVEFKPYRVSLSVSDVISKEEAVKKINEQVKSATVTFSAEGDIKLTLTGTHPLLKTGEAVETQVITDKQFPVGAAVAVSKLEFYPLSEIKMGHAYQGSLLPTVEVVNTVVPVLGTTPGGDGGKSKLAYLLIPAVLILLLLLPFVRPVNVSVGLEPAGSGAQAVIFRDARGPDKVRVVLNVNSKEQEFILKRNESRTVAIEGIGYVQATVRTPGRRNVSKNKYAELIVCKE